MTNIDAVILEAPRTIKANLLKKFIEKTLLYHKVTSTALLLKFETSREEISTPSLFFSTSNKGDHRHPEKSC